MANHMRKNIKRYPIRAIVRTTRQVLELLPKMMPELLSEQNRVPLLFHTKLFIAYANCQTHCLIGGDPPKKQVAQEMPCKHTYRESKSYKLLMSDTPDSFLYMIEV